MVVTFLNVNTSLRGFKEKGRYICFYVSKLICFGCAINVTLGVHALRLETSELHKRHGCHTLYTSLLRFKNQEFLAKVGTHNQ